MKKISAFLLALTLVLALTGCAGQKEKPLKAPPSVSEPAASEPAVSEPDASEPADASKASYDANGDGIIQTPEFPIPTGDALGMTGEDARLYTAAAQAQIETLLQNMGESAANDTMLVLPIIRVYDKYDGENGEAHYICGYGTGYYYDLGTGLADPKSPVYSSYGGGGTVARITLAEDGSIVEILETFDGGDNTKQIQEICGPLTELAEKLNSGNPDPEARQLLPADQDEKLMLYLNAYFA